MKKYIIVGLTMFPLLIFAEGQYALELFSDIIDFIKVFSIWAIMILTFTKTYDHIVSDKLNRQKKKIIWIVTGIIALFVWSMIKYDPQPYDGPIDSIFK